MKLTKKQMKNELRMKTVTKLKHELRIEIAHTMFVFHFSLCCDMFDSILHKVNIQCQKPMRER